MKLASTPPQRYRPRVDYEGTPIYSMQRVSGGNRAVKIRLNGERQWTLEMSIDEYKDLRNFVDRVLEGHSGK